MAENTNLSACTALLEKAMSDSDRAYAVRNAEWKAGRLDIMQLSGGDEPQIEDAMQVLSKAGVSRWDETRNMPRGPSRMLAAAKEMIANG
jgi:hypothetical protein